MGLLTRDDRSLTASAAEIDLSDPASIKRWAYAKRQWQVEACEFYERVAEVHYPANFIGSSLSRFLLGIGQRIPGESQPKPVETPSSNVEKALDLALEQFQGPQGGHAEHLRRFGLNWTIAADMYLLGRTRTGDWPEWETLSMREVSPLTDGVFRRFSSGVGSESTSSNPSSNISAANGYMVRRIWKASPIWSDLADGALSALNADCKRLIALNDSITARILSRLSSNGIFVLPQGISINGQMVQPNAENPMWQVVLNKMGSNITGDNPAASALPLMVSGPSGTAKEIAHITMSETIDHVEMELRKELRHNIAVGMDLPPEVQTGLADSSHFATWTVMDSSYRTHLVPVVDQAIEAWTRIYLFPAVLAMKDPATGQNFTRKDLRGYCMIADGSNVVVRPNESQDARELYDRDALAPKALRRRSGVTEAEKPSDLEIIQAVGRKHGNVVLATMKQEDLAKLTDPDFLAVVQEGQLRTGGRSGAGTTPESRVPVENGGSSTQAPGKNAGAPGAGTADGGAAGKMTAEVMASAAKMALVAADAKVGAKLRSLAQRDPTVVAALSHVGNERVYAAMTDTQLREIGVSEPDLLGLFNESLNPLQHHLGDSIGAELAAEYVSAISYERLGSRFSTISVESLAALAMKVLNPASV